jgi:hypothetical protein
MVQGKEDDYKKERKRKEEKRGERKEKRPELII